MYLAKSVAPTPVYIWGHAKGQTYKRVPKDAVSLCLDAGYSFLSIEANDDNNDGMQDLHIKEPWGPLTRRSKTSPPMDSRETILKNMIW